ncbi:MAG: ribonuclease HI [Desulfovibrio sp.]|nr:ribonuclease HI [Desulfovibrio sp.]
MSPVAAKAGRGGEGLPEVAAFTDGACRGNPGPGGWAALVYLDDCARCLELTGGSPRTTNNRMEILAVIEALAAVPDRSRVTVYTDSRYVCDAVEKGWLRKWRATGWVRRAGAFGPAQPVKNVDLWQRLTPLLERHEVTMRWVSGHSGHPQNERCDRLARAAADASG